MSKSGRKSEMESGSKSTSKCKCNSIGARANVGVRPRARARARRKSRARAKVWILSSARRYKSGTPQRHSVVDRMMAKFEKLPFCLIISSYCVCD